MPAARNGRRHRRATKPGPHGGADLGRPSRWWDHGCRQEGGCQWRLPSIAASHRSPWGFFLTQSSYNHRKTFNYWEPSNYRRLFNCRFLDSNLFHFRVIHYSILVIHSLLIHCEVLALEPEFRRSHTHRIQQLCRLPTRPRHRLAHSKQDY